MIVALAGLPHLHWPVVVDPFHDGQNLSAVWEFEQGRPLYSEVFPLRGCDFFLTWLTRKVSPPTLIGSTALLHFGQPAVMAGACLISYAWTRSAVWSVLAGLLVIPCVGKAAGIREGLFMLVAAVALELLRSDRRRSWFGLAPLGLPMFLAGYDNMVPYLGGLAAVALADLVDRAGRRGGATLRDRLLTSGSVPVLAILLFTGIIVVWQGLPSAAAYWQIFVDYAQHYAAFYGLPSKAHSWWQFPNDAIGVLGLFAAGGVVCWSAMRGRRRRQWAFLLIGTFLYCARGLGRSDPWHVVATVPLILLVLWLTLFEAARWMARRTRSDGATAEWGISLPSGGRGVIGWLAIVGLGWIVWSNVSDPVRLWGTLRDIPGQETLDILVDPRIAGMVPSGESLWPIENGMANYAHRRPNPTRHAIAYCIGSPGEQRRAVADMKRHRTPVIDWEWGSIDGIDGFVRQYLIAQHVLRRYRPFVDERSADARPLAVPAEEGWPGLMTIPAGFSRSQYLQKLPLAWGERRWPGLAGSAVSSPSLTGWVPTVAEIGGEGGGWEAAVEIDPRRVNYLRMELTGGRNDRLKSSHRLRLEFASVEAEAGEYDAESRVEFDVPPDGRRHVYLVPVGCHPSWVWRPRIGRLRIRTENVSLEFPPDVTACEIAEVD